MYHPYMMFVCVEELFTRLHYYYRHSLRRTLRGSVRYSAVAKSSFCLNVAAIRGVGEKKTPTAA